MSNLSDRELVTLAKKELPYQTVAFEILLNRYQNRIYQICKRVLQDSHLAEDATQNTMLKVFHYLKDFKQESSFLTWVYRIAYNESLQIINSNKNYKVLEYIESLQIGFEDIDYSLETEEIFKHISKEEQELLVLKYFLEFKDVEIGDTLHLSLSAVKMRLKRLKEKCQTFLAHEDKEEI